MDETFIVIMWIVGVFQLVLVWLHFNSLGRIARATEQLARTAETESTTRFNTAQETRRLRGVAEELAKACGEQLEAHDGEGRATDHMYDSSLIPQDRRSYALEGSVGQTLVRWKKRLKKVVPSAIRHAIHGADQIS